MPTVWAVIGDSNMHKTSSIRAMTGVGRKEPQWQVEYMAYGNASTFVHPAGLQEMNISPQAFIQDVHSACVQHVIVALRYVGAHGQPDAAGYLAAFRAANWNIAGYAVLGPGVPLATFGKGVSISNAPQMPSNEIAAQLRAAWGIA